ncbi:MAG TPA: transposase, partial [Roseiflexaceae bacterium]
ERPSLKIVHSQVLQHVQVRVDLAFKAFFRRVKAGEQEVGYPRFKGYGRYDTITYPKVVSRIYERIANRRSDFAHRLSRKLVNRFGIIAFEDLNAQGMLKNHCLAKSIADAAWDQLVRYTTSKAAEAGRRVVLVDPRNTSKRCSRCGQLVPKDLSVRVHACPVCGLVIDRDENAAINILALGLQCLGASP